MSIITCPSGLQVKIRGLKVKEEKILTDRKLAKSGEQVAAILKACTVELIDSGLYPFETIDWLKLLQGDRFYILLKIREASYGSEYEFAVNCTNAQCRERFEWVVDTNELQVKRVEGAVDIAAPITVTLPVAGVSVKFHRAIGADEVQQRKLLKREGNEHSHGACGLMVRIDSIGTVDSTDGKAKREFIEELDMLDVEFLREQFDLYDYGVETGIEVECPECGQVMHLELPFGDRFFTKRKSKKLGASSGASTSNVGRVQSSISAGSSTEDQG